MARLAFTRREALTTAAAALYLAGAGCSAGRRAARPTSVPVRPLVLVSGHPNSAEQDLVQQFNAAQTALQAAFLPIPVPGQSGPPSQATPLSEASASFAQSGPDLSPWMKQRNIQLSAFVPGVWDAVSNVRGGIWAVPLRIGITIVRVDAAALQKAGVQVPADGLWAVDKFVGSISALAAQAKARWRAFGPGLGWSWAQWAGTGLDGAPPPVWLGFASGFGGRVVRGVTANLTAGPVLQGLQLYGDALQQTAVTGPIGGDRSFTGPWLGFGVLPVSAAETGVTSGQAGSSFAQSGSTLQYLRFPVFPVEEVVPAVVSAWAGIPPNAPHPDRGAAFLMWLLSQEGQVALNAAGFTATRMDTNIPRPWWGAGALGRFGRPDQLAFVPGMLADVNFSSVIFRVLAQPAARRQAQLVAIQAALEHYLEGDASAADTGRALQKISPVAPNGPN